jgi:hypothetical protein
MLVINEGIVFPVAERKFTNGTDGKNARFPKPKVGINIIEGHLLLIAIYLLLVGATYYMDEWFL